MKATDRRLAAIVFTDIVGYSAMMQKDEVLTMKLRNKHREEFNKFTNTHNGKIIQYFGDGTLSIYPSATDAVEFAVALQKALKSADPPVPMRIGIHTGDITYGKEDAYGDGVNVAARIESMCIPGGVFISGKVYDDIKNHSRLRATYLGLFNLKNIQDAMEIYAVSNRGITVPELEPIPVEPPAQEKGPPKVRGGRKKWVAGLLGIAFGVFGAQRFYVGHRVAGMVFLIAFLIGISEVGDLDFLIPMAAVGGFVDGLLMLFMPKIRFDKKFNKEFIVEEKKEDFKEDQVNILNQSKYLKDQFELYLDRGLEDFQHYDYREAVYNFTRAAEIRYDDPEVHFLLARCYSKLKNADKGIAHLDAAVAFGLDHDRVEFNQDLAFLRIQPTYKAFESNDFRLPQSNIEEFLEEEAETDPTPLPTPDLLEQLQRLQKLRDQGILTEEEYLMQQKKMKNDKAD